MSKQEQAQVQQKVEAAGQKEAQGKSGPHVVIPQQAPEPGETPQQEADSPVVNISVSSSAVDPSGSLAATYTCNGGTSPPVRWEGVPESAQELVVLVANVAPAEGGLEFDWSVGGIDPEEAGLEAGRIPNGAVLGKNSDGKSGYSLCPSGSQQESYVLTVYALERAVHPKAEFNPEALREKAIEESSSAGLLSMSVAR
ncbi:MAG: hypothetical protein JST59_14580 [Actinobacteria bacterium]|nr:hypothetical protein [Actinomycetota bacterium]